MWMHGNQPWELSEKLYIFFDNVSIDMAGFCRKKRILFIKGKIIENVTKQKSDKFAIHKRITPVNNISRERERYDAAKENGLQNAARGLNLL